MPSELFMEIGIIWGLKDDPESNYWHIVVAGHGITQEEVEEVLRHPDSVDWSNSSGQPISFGWTSTGKHLVVVWEHVQDDPLTIYPVTAYETQPAGINKHERV